MYLDRESGTGTGEAGLFVVLRPSRSIKFMPSAVSKLINTVHGQVSLAVNQYNVVDVFYGPSTLFRSFRTRSVNLSTLFLGILPLLSAHSVASN